MLQIMQMIILAATAIFLLLAMIYKFKFNENGNAIFWIALAIFVQIV